MKKIETFWFDWFSNSTIYKKNSTKWFKLITDKTGYRDADASKKWSHLKLRSQLVVTREGIKWYEPFFGAYLTKRNKLIDKNNF